jgi:hypothetical protein
MIIWIASYPRSGNTFFRILINQIYGIKTYSIHNDPIFERLKNSSELIGHHKLEMNYEEMAVADKLFFVKTHYLPSDNYPAVYLVRDGRDSLVSYAHYISSFHKSTSLKEHWKRKIKSIIVRNEYDEILSKLIMSPRRDAKGNFGTWSENVSQWIEREGVTFQIKFEDLIKNPYQCIAAAMEELNFQKEMLSSNSIPSFEELHRKYPQFFRQGQSGKWRQEMSQPLQDLFWQYHGEVMESLGYER